MDDPVERADALRPISGTSLDPPPTPTPELVRRIERANPWTRSAWPGLQRFKAANIPLIAGGTAYYAFIAFFSLVAVAYGLAALFSADELADWITRSLDEALPGLVGADGIDPTRLQRLGTTTSTLGLVALAWSGSAVMAATSDALRQVYGAAPDPRNPLRRRARLVGWLAALGPLVALSSTLTTAVTAYGTEILRAWGLDGGGAQAAVVVGALLLTLLLDLGILWLLLGRLGGIRPPRKPLLIGAATGAVVIGLLKALMATIVAWSVARPQYGSFTVPVALLVVLWLQAMTLYAAACITAAGADARPR